MKPKNKKARSANSYEYGEEVYLKFNHERRGDLDHRTEKFKEFVCSKCKQRLCAQGEWIKFKSIVHSSADPSKTYCCFFESSTRHKMHLINLVLINKDKAKSAWDREDYQINEQDRRNNRV